MTIVWGHNNFRLKAIQPEELGLINKELSGISFELRQKYGHLFWIPFIPLGKFWVVKKPDGKLYHCPADIEAQLRERFPMRTSLWAWTGPLLILAGLVIFNISEKMEEHRWQNFAKEAYVNAANTVDEKIKNIKANDYLLMAVKHNGNNYYEYNKIPVKVLRVDGDNLTACSISSKYKNEDAAIVEGPGQEIENYNSEEDIAGMEFKHGIKDSFVISKAVLRSAVCHDNLGENQFPGISIKEFTKAGTCMLKDIVHVEGPVLKMVPLTAEKQDGHYYEFKNMGFNVHADSIITFKKDAAWQLSKERQFYYGDIIAIKCNSKDSAILYSSDWKKRVYKNKIDNTDYNIKFEATAMQ